MVQKEKKYITWEGLNQHAKNVGKKIKECDTGVIGGYNGSFPLTAATKGNIYLLPATKKYYVCIKNYNGSQLTAPNANFEELSVYTNRSKLDNLQENKILETIKISYGTDSYADVIKTGNQIWLYIRFYSETGQVTIPQNTKLFKLKDEYILGNKSNKYMPLVFPVYEREISNDMFLFSIVSGYVQPNTQFSFAGNTHCGFVRLI